VKANCVDYVPELASRVIHYTDSYSVQDYCTAEGNSCIRLFHFGWSSSSVEIAPFIPLY